MIEIGDLFVVMSVDDKRAPTAGRTRINVPPLGKIFGAGWHPSTQTAVRALENLLKRGMSFADIGAGAGTVCVAAKKLGAGKVFACELAPDALEILPRVFSANAVDVEIVNGTYPPEIVDLALINIGDEPANEISAELRQFAEKIVIVRDDSFSYEVI